MEPNWEELRQARKDIDSFCRLNGIKRIGREFHFEINGQKYLIGRRKIVLEVTTGYRGLKEATGTSTKVIYISAKQCELPRIFNDLKAGYKLTSTGERITDGIQDTREESPR